MKSIVPGGKTMTPGGRYRRGGKLSERPGPPVAGTGPTGNGPTGNGLISADPT